MDEGGLEASVRALHDAHAPALHAWARRRTGDATEAEEVVQETLVLAWRKHSTYDPSRGSERAWVFGIARNVAAERYRRRERRAGLAGSQSVSTDAGLDDDVERVVEESFVRDALLSLSDEHRTVVVRAYYGGESVREIAHALAIPEGTVKSRLFYALRALRGALETAGVLE